MNKLLLKICDDYVNKQDSIYIVEIDKENYVLKHIEVPLVKGKTNIALKISSEEKDIDFHFAHAKCIKVLINEKIGWSNTKFFQPLSYKDY